MQNYKYQLQSYTTTKESRHTCPQCGHKNEFTLYVDADNKPINETVGKCNRESKCGYHLTPSEWFKDHPSIEREFKPIHRTMEKPITYLPKDVLSSEHRAENNLYRFLIQHFDKEKVDKVFDAYRIGASKHWYNSDGYATTFPQIDEQGRLRRIKVMAYNPNTGKRLKKQDQPLAWSEAKQKYYVDTFENDKVWWACKTIIPEGNFKQTFFGCHLIPNADNIGMVESEKTAVICSILIPEITWIATGGCKGGKWTELNVFKPLVGKKVCLYPDSGMYQEWKEKALILRKAGVNVIVYDICEGLQDNLDIADVLLGHAEIGPKKRPTADKKDSSENSTPIENSTPSIEDGILHTVGEVAAYCKEIGCTNVSFYV